MKCDEYFCINLMLKFENHNMTAVKLTQIANNIHDKFQVSNLSSYPPY